MTETIQPGEPLAKGDLSIFQRISLICIGRNTIGDWAGYTDPLGEWRDATKLMLLIIPSGLKTYAYQSEYSEPLIATKMESEGFECPVCLLEEHPYVKDREGVPNIFKTIRSTPYGRLPEAVLGKDGVVYYFYNSYVFDQKGRAKKIETVDREDDLNPFNEVYCEEDRRFLKRLDFIPDLNDTRLVDLEPGDYEKIMGILNEIENGVRKPTDLIEARF